MNIDIPAQSILDGDDLALVRVNQTLESMTAQERVCWGCENLPNELIVSSSFGIQSAVMLHLMTSIKPRIPVLLIDTGYLFTETYQFVDQLTERLDLNLKVYSARMSRAWQEARNGQLWEEGKSGIDRYNQVNKVEIGTQITRQLGTMVDRHPTFAIHIQPQHGPRALLSQLHFHQFVPLCLDFRFELRPHAADGFWSIHERLRKPYPRAGNLFHN